MRVPWLSLTAVATLAALAMLNLQARPPRVGSAPAVVSAQDAAPSLKRKGATTPFAAIASLMTPTASQAASSLIIPVAGVTRNDLTDTWGQARSEGRTHEGIDILAPMGTPVLAAADGRIIKFFDSARGGITVYEFDASARFVYYYAHLSARAPGLAEGMAVRQGQVIAFVGMTGNAPVTHLHFEVERLGLDRRWWHAQAMNPYPLLMAGMAPSA